jgi:hypothetical protein
MKFEAFKSIPRLSKECIITEKIDGTNAQIVIIQNYDIEVENAKTTKEVDAFFNKYLLHSENGICLFAGSKNRWLDTTSKGDNFGFAKWVQENALDLVLGLGEGRHYGEWMGLGVQRGYGLQEKKFYLFNTNRWHKEESRLVSVDPKTKVEKYTDKCPNCCYVVPILYQGPFDTAVIDNVLDKLKAEGSVAVPSYMNPEGIVVYHKASGQLFKKTFDDRHKGEV